MASAPASTEPTSDLFAGDLPSPPKPPRTRLLLIALAVAVGLVLLVTGLVYALVRDRLDTINQATAQRLSALADGKAEVLGTWIDGLTQLGHRLTRSELVQLFTSELALDDSSAALQDALAAQMPYMKQVLADFTRQHDLIAAYITDTEGRWLLGTIGADQITRRDDLSMTFGHRDVTHSVGPISITGGAQIIEIILPIEGPQPTSDEAFGLVGALFYRVEANAALVKVLGDSGAALDGEKTFLLAPTSEGVGLIEATDKGSLSLIERTLSVEPGMEIGYGSDQDIDAVPRQVQGVAVPRLPWTLIQTAASDRVFQPLNRFIVTALIIAACLSAALIAAAIAFVSRQENQHQAAIVEQYRRFVGRLKRQQKLLASITDTVREMITVKSREGHYLFANPAFAAVQGRGQERLVGAHDRDLFEPDISARIEQADREAMRIGATLSDDEDLTIGGRTRHLESSRVPLRNEDDKITGIVCVSRDVTQLVEQRRRQDALRRQLVQALVHSIELRDPYLVGHSERVRTQALRIADHLNLGEEERTTIDLAAALSQIGKSFIAKELLEKPDRHTEDEQREMQRHIEHATRILDGIDFDLPVAKALASMHERPDGSGYPMGLSGKKVGMVSRILGVADVYCARMEPRSYRARAEPAEIIKVLREHPERYDPTVVDALMATALAVPSHEERAAAE